jgi:hypothetical protein
MLHAGGLIVALPYRRHPIKRNDIARIAIHGTGAKTS